MTPFANPTRHLFFTGKGGVGKTALACAAALSLADRGKRVLLVSTDPASNLDEMLGVALGSEPTPVPGVASLSAMNIDPEAAAEAYRARVIAPYEGVKTGAEVRTIREQLSGACTTEIAAFDQFAGLLSGADLPSAFDHVLFDTAPTGHTLRLLQLPRAWTTFLETNEHGASCLGPHSGLTMHHERFAAAMNALMDARSTTVVLVARPNVGALREAARTAAELHSLGVDNQWLVVNAVFRAQDRSDRVALAFEQRCSAALDTMPTSLRALPRYDVPLKPFNMVGLPALRALLEDGVEDGAVPPSAASDADEASQVKLPNLSDVVDGIAAKGSGLVMVMGKGGVGKTTVAAAVAVELAVRGFSVHLSTTDPAAHVAATVAGAIPHLEISRIDPAEETRAYVSKVIERKGPSLDAEGRALLEEDLRSPCTEEVAVFHAFSKLVAQARSGFVVLDTAPTGHTLLLLDATGSYHRDVMRGLTPDEAKRLKTPLMRLQDPDYTKVLVVTLPETTPVSEAGQLQEDLRRAKIEPYAWVVNASLAASGTRDPLLRERIPAELRQIARIGHDFAGRVAIIPWMTDEPIGVANLRAVVRGEQATQATNLPRHNVSSTDVTDRT
ncbi:MAG: arsenical pump-driving ATPase [Myxococcales bacterium]|nr:arsenical pump-driving ATPase [Myxococcales bacterium]